MATQTGRPLGPAPRPRPRRAWPHLASPPRPAASAPPPSRPAPAGPCCPARGRHRARDPRPWRLPCPDRRAPRPPPAHLQGAEEEVPEGLHGAERVLQGQLLGVLAQVVGQLQLLPLEGLEHLLQGPRRLDAGLGVVPGGHGAVMGLGAAAPGSGEAPRPGPPGGWTAEPPPGGGGPGPGALLPGDTPGTPATLACRRGANCCCTSGADDTFRSISSSFFRLVLASEWIISRLTLKGTAGQAGSGDSDVQPYWTAGPGPTHGPAPRGATEPWDRPSGVGRGAHRGGCRAVPQRLSPSSPLEVQPLANHRTFLSSRDPGPDGLRCPRSRPLWAL